MHLKLPTHSNKLMRFQISDLRLRSAFHRALLLFITLLVVSGTIAAQDTRQTPEQAAMKSMAEGLQLLTEGSPTSLSKAIEKFESARVLMHSLNNTLGEAALLSITGSAHFLLGQTPQAIEKYEQSLPLFRAAGDKKGEAAVFLQLGQLYGTLGDIQKALDSLGRALPLFHDAGEPQGEMITLSSIGSFHMFLGKLRRPSVITNKLRRSLTPEVFVRVKQLHLRQLARSTKKWVSRRTRRKALSKLCRCIAPSTFLAVRL